MQPSLYLICRTIPLRNHKQAKASLKIVYFLHKNKPHTGGVLFTIKRILLLLLSSISQLCVDWGEIWDTMLYIVYLFTEISNHYYINCRQLQLRPVSDKGHPDRSFVCHQVTSALPSTQPHLSIDINNICSRITLY